MLSPVLCWYIARLLAFPALLYISRTYNWILFYTLFLFIPKCTLKLSSYHLAFLVIYQILLILLRCEQIIDDFIYFLFMFTSILSQWLFLKILSKCAVNNLCKNYTSLSHTLSNTYFSCLCIVELLQCYYHVYSQ